METKFQTSFIPKKPIASAIGGVSSVAPRKHTSSIFMTIATILFIASLVAAGGTYAYKQYLINDQVTQKEQLAAREKEFNTDLIEKLKNQDVKIGYARQLLNNHLALSQIFDIIGRLTIENVRFLSMDLTAPTTGSDGIKISLQGLGTSLSAVAFQSDVLSKLDDYGLRKVIKNPVLTNPVLNANRSVSFGFSAVVDPSTLSYEKLVSPASAASSDAPVNQAPQQNTNTSAPNPFTTQ
ncbi:MAG TPA: hypothetical protein VL335_02470 [Candidatus Paceibacterota bacterium]|jgi:hypothetical protein|nr:hypothetical protein [Candidatus Paceibacterota bacterium]